MNTCKCHGVPETLCPAYGLKLRPKAGCPGTWRCDKHGTDNDYRDECAHCVVARKQQSGGQKTGGSVDYYKCHVADPIDPNAKPYTAESIDIIEALGMTFAEGEAFKAIWRTCTGRMGGAVKADNKALYNAEKVEFFGARMVRAAKRSEAE